jgi:hypothetical protein
MPATGKHEAPGPGAERSAQGVETPRVVPVDANHVVCDVAAFLDLSLMGFFEGALGAAGTPYHARTQITVGGSTSQAPGMRGIVAVFRLGDVAKASAELRGKASLYPLTENRSQLFAWYRRRLPRDASGTHALHASAGLAHLLGTVQLHFN